jgi:Kef-type K+ transport system membrane component KefB
VTVYLLVGLALGPGGLLRLFDPDVGLGRMLLGPSTGGPLDGLGELAVGFILFGIGAEFRFEVFRRVGARVLGVSAAEIGLTALLVGLAVLAGTGDWRLAVIAPPWSPCARSRPKAPRRAVSSSAWGKTTWWRCSPFRCC